MLRKPRIKFALAGKLLLGALSCFAFAISGSQDSVAQSAEPAIAGSSASSMPRASAKQNVILFMVDDLGWADVGYQGSTLYRTPNIDLLATRGVRFSQAYAACPVCSPTRASVLTGQYPARLGLTDWLPGRKNFDFQKLRNAETVQHLPYDQPTLPRVLKENGYRTAIFGKWHLGEDADSTKRQGFDVQVPHWNKGWPNQSYFATYGMNGLEGGPDGEYLTDRLTEEALRWVEQNRDQPFFLYLSHFAVHDPIQGRPDLVAGAEQRISQVHSSASPPFILEGNPDDPNPFSAEAALNRLLRDERYRGFSLLPNRAVKIKQRQDNPEFAAMVESVDQSLGRVIARLKQLHLDDNTILIFFSDNGGMSAANFGNPNRKIGRSSLDKAYSTSNLPLRGGKGWLYEGGIRVPLIIYRPGLAGNGTDCDIPVISTDLYATILDLLGLPLEKSQNAAMDGVSLAPALNGFNDDEIAKRALYWHWPHYSNHGAQSPAGAVRSGDFKLIEYYENQRVQLFNLRTDPGETRDLSQSEPGKARELRTLLRNWRNQVNAAMPLPNPDYKPGTTWPGAAL